MNSRDSADGADSMPGNHPSRILFGSCNNQDYSQPLWKKILERNAAAFVWGGDAVYADSNTGLDWSTFPPKPKVQEATPELLDAIYKQQLAHKEYRKVVERMEILGSIDDHDFGANNGDIRYQYKRESAIAYVETFLGEPKHSVMASRARKGAGIYGVKLFDFGRSSNEHLLPDEDAGIDPATPINEQTAYSNKSVAIFLLDVRSFKTPWVETGFNKYFQNREGDFLGEQQWKWLELALNRSKASINIIVNGLQVHGDKFCDGNIGEAWGRFPSAQNRLYNTILQSGVKAPILISGDVHQAELSRKDCYLKPKETTRPIVEMTTSGLTHSWGSKFCSRSDSNFICQSPFTTLATRAAMTIGHWINPWYELIETDGMEGAKQGLQYALDYNFGEIEFDWDSNSVHVRVHGLESAKPLLSVNWTLDQLSGTSPMDKVILKPSDFARVKDQDGPWICSHYRGVPNPIHSAVAQIASLATVTLLIASPMVVIVASVAFCCRRSVLPAKEKKA